MSDTFRTDEAVREFLYIPRFAPKRDDFKAEVVVQVHVQGGNDKGMALVLQIGQFLRQKPSVMVIDQGERAYHRRVGSDDCEAHQPVTDQIAKGLGPVLVALVPDERIKTTQ